MNNNYNIIRIQRYLAGQLSREEMYEIEREALDDPFLSDALEGYRMQSEVNHGKLSLLQQRLATRIEGQREEKHRFYFTSQRLAVATAAAVLFVLVIVLFWMRHTLNPADQGGLAGSEGVLIEKEVLVELPANGQPAGAGEISVVVVEPGTAQQSDTFIQDLHHHFQQELNWELLQSVGVAGEQYRLNFEVSDQGRPIQVTVASEGAIRPEVQEELIRVLEAGPIWTGPEGTVEVRF